MVARREPPNTDRPDPARQNPIRVLMGIRSCLDCTASARTLNAGGQDCREGAAVATSLEGLWGPERWDASAAEPAAPQAESRFLAPPNVRAPRTSRTRC